jgi:hypothetical protein
MLQFTAMDVAGRRIRRVRIVARPVNVVDEE